MIEPRILHYLHRSQHRQTIARRELFKPDADLALLVYLLQQQLTDDVGLLPDDQRNQDTATLPLEPDA